MFLSALRSSDIEEKEWITQKLLAYCTQNSEIERGYTPKRFAQPSYADICTIVAPKALPKRKAFDTREGLAILTHAIAHIEFSAIDLALDAAYRFCDMPAAFVIDWLEVASDEIRHFKMLSALLAHLGYRYGDFPVHSGLFEAGKRSAHDALERMAIVPRFYEATGLDVNPQIIAKLRAASHFEPAARLVEALELIYREEIEHVRKGDRWFAYLCAQRGVEKAIYFDIVARYGLQRQRPHINVEARKAAGFSCDEILKLGAKRCE